MPRARVVATALLALLLAPALAGCLGPSDGNVPTPPSPTSGTPPPAADPAFALEKVADGFDQPTLVTHAGDGSGRLFVVEQSGRVKLLKDGKVAEAPFLDVSDLTAAGGERGLLGLAFDPAFEESGRVYVHYTDTEGDTVLARYHVDASDPDRVVAGSARVLLTVDQPFGNHNGGMIAFGPDGYLYMGLGDGGSAGDPKGNAQDTRSLLGKILRLDVSGRDGYEIPPTNPFAAAGGRQEVWAYGLRNPWRFSFDRETGDLWIGDVGQNHVEEIDYQPASSKGGENYGWNVWEGSRRFRPGTAEGAVFPVAEYSHDGGHCSVTGGYVYRGERVPAMRGVYLYADYCSGKSWGLTAEGGAWKTHPLRDLDFRVSSFGEDESGEVYVVDHGGAIYRLAPESA